MNVNILIDEKTLPVIEEGTFSDHAKTHKLLEDLFNWADSNKIGSLERHEFTYFMIASTLVHAIFDQKQKNKLSLMN